MMQNHSKTRLRMGLSKPPETAVTRIKTAQASGGEIQAILFAGFSPGLHPAASHADDKNKHADTGQHQQERRHGAPDDSGLILPD